MLGEIAILGVLPPQRKMKKDEKRITTLKTKKQTNLNCFMILFVAILCFRSKVVESTFEFREERCPWNGLSLNPERYLNHEQDMRGNNLRPVCVMVE